MRKCEVIFARALRLGGRWLFGLCLCFAGEVEAAKLSAVSAGSYGLQRLIGVSGVQVEAAMYVVENHVLHDGEMGESLNDSEKTAPDPAEEPNTVRSDKGRKGKNTRLKPFVPSEEIAAEQAVDFPADI